jgi:phosphate uptake regulator
MTELEKVAMAICIARYGHLRGFYARREQYEKEASAALAVSNGALKAENTELREQAVALIARIRELEELIDEICEYRNTVARFEPDTQEKLDAYERVRTQTAAEQ